MPNHIRYDKVKELAAFKTIYVYGSGSKGRLLLNLIKNNGLENRFGGFVDSAKSGTLGGLPVYRVDDAEARPLLGDKDSIIVIASYATPEISITLENLNFFNYIVFDEHDFSMEHYWDKLTRCNLLFFEHGRNIDTLRDLQPNQKIIVFVDGFRVANPSTESIVKTIEDATQCTVSALQYTDAIDPYGTPDLPDGIQGALLFPLYSITIDGALRALRHIAKAKHPPKLSIYNHEGTPMRQCIVLDQYKLIFMPIAKCGSTSLVTSFRNSLGLDYTDDIHDSSGVRSIYKSIDITADTYKSYFKFTVTRNPYARVVSLYKSFSGMAYIPHYLRKHTGQDVSFQDFCTFVSKSPDVLAELHYRSQYAYIYATDGTCLVDYVGKLESLGDTLKHVNDAVGTHIPYHHLNKSDFGKNYSDYFADPSQMETIFQRYSKDFSLFGYPR